MTQELLVRLFRSIEGEPTEDIILVAEKIIEEEAKKGHNRLASKLNNTRDWKRARHVVKKIV
jgi:hypothetical protein